MSPQPFVAIHVGAGNHSPKKRAQYKAIGKESIELGLDLLKEGHSSEQVAAIVGKHLEDSRLTNSGSGSQMNARGEVECDASLMSSRDLAFTAVGGVSGVLNPVDVAYRLLQNLRGPRDKRGRAKPVFLTGRGAKEFAEQSGAKIVPPYSMVSQANQRTYDLWKAVLENDERKEEYGLESEDDENINDTIGIICYDKEGILTVAASSGGIIMKQPGRIGPAACPWSGICVQKSSDGVVGASCATGHGEDILTTRLSTLCQEYLHRYDGDETQAYPNLFQHIQTWFPVLQSQPLYLGLLSALVTETDVTISYAHTSESMILAYGSLDSKPKAVHSTNKSVGSVCFGAASL